MYNFPEKILLGYKLEGEEFGKWTMRAATTVMVPRTYDKKSKKGKTCEFSSSYHVTSGIMSNLTFGNASKSGVCVE
jgi:hypothetical protein